MMFKNSALIVGLCCTAIVTESASSTPVIGILSQPFINSDNETEYFIAGSYVQWLEAAGARSIAIPYDSTNVDEYFPQINGLFFPGGGIDEIPNSAWRLWELALDANSVGHFFPVWGTCLGFEYMVMMASGMGLAAMSHGFDATNISLPLELTSSESLLYRQTRIREIALTQNVTMNNHHLGLSLDTFASSPDLAAMFHATSVNTDRQGRSFVSTIEPIYPDLHPFYGVQYHPEKNLFEYGTYPDTNVPYEAIHHDPDAIDFSLHLARFFVNLTNRNLEQGVHQYTQPDVYPMVYTYPMRPGVKFQQSYIIPSGSEQSVASEL
jgi:gamma-glutamyl hydrolase